MLVIKTIVVIAIALLGFTGALVLESIPANVTIKYGNSNKTITTTRIPNLMRISTAIPNAKTALNMINATVVTYSNGTYDTEDDERLLSEELTSETERVFLAIVKQMPHGWPEHAIPPLDPYINKNLALTIANNFLSTNTTFRPLHITGLGNIDVILLNACDTLGKIDFDLNFPNITASGTFNTSTLLNLEKAFNISLQIHGNADFDIILENFRFYGHFKYKLIPTEAVRIHKLVMLMSLGQVHSSIQGDINTMHLTKYFNRYIERSIMKFINERNTFFHSLFQNAMEALINADMEGGTLCRVLAWALEKEYPTLRAPDDGNGTDDTTNECEADTSTPRHLYM